MISELKNFVASGASYAAKMGETDDLVMSTLLVVRMMQLLQSYHQNLDEQMRDVVRQARLLAKNLRDKFDLTYEDKTTAAAAPSRPAPAAAGGVVDFGSLR